MSILDMLPEAISNERLIVCECRHCGEKLPEGATECLNCGADEVVQYEF